MNQLSKEKSPYLLQHKDNPVHWYAWGEEAIKAAVAQDKPIFLSVGYSTCHWCHVMAHQSFEDQEVADFLNDNFISIKLDREERPDLDEIYMNALHTMGQRGGWPLSMFLTPELKPFFGGTYWPKANFLQILAHLSGLWKNKRSEVEEGAGGLTHHLKEQAQISKVAELPNAEALLNQYYEYSLQSFDHRYGGFGAAPKFPHAMQLSLLLHHDFKRGAPKALQMVVQSLEAMARGGIYDHVGGGFARYSVDARWDIPHFEKMLYDNALLTVTYLEAYQLTGIEMFASVARETLDYVLARMTHPEGGFYSAEDADSEGVEGKYYVWGYEDLKEILSGKELEAVDQAFQISPSGNFEGKIHLNLKESTAWQDKKEGELASALKKLKTIREKRIPPHKDDKILTAWNGLMIKAMAMGARVLKEEKYLKAAQAASDFLEKHLYTPEGLLARYREGEARFKARLEDYSFWIEGVLEIYESRLDNKTLELAIKLQKAQDELFWDSEEGGYFLTDGTDEHLIYRSKEAVDGALPNANGVAALNLLRLYAYTGEATLVQKAQNLFKAFAKRLESFPQAMATMLLALDWEESAKKGHFCPPGEVCYF